MGLTRKQAVRLHRELWDWLYENPDKKKHHWPRWELNNGRIKEVHSECFLCHISDFDCEACILNPKPFKNTTYTNTDKLCLGGLWQRWNDVKTPKTRKKYAALIRDLPERTDI